MCILHEGARTGNLAARHASTLVRMEGRVAEFDRTMQETALQRWSRLKREARNNIEPERPAETAPDFATADVSAVEANPTDLAELMSAVGDPVLRVAALRTLWQSDPSIGAPDGLDVYQGDYTGCAATSASPSLESVLDEIARARRVAEDLPDGSGPQNRARGSDVA